MEEDLKIQLHPGARANWMVVQPEIAALFETMEKEMKPSKHYPKFDDPIKQLMHKMGYEVK